MPLLTFRGVLVVQQLALQSRGERKPAAGCRPFDYAQGRLRFDRPRGHADGCVARPGDHADHGQQLPCTACWLPPLARADAVCEWMQ